MAMHLLKVSLFKAFGKSFAASKMSIKLKSTAASVAKEAVERFIAKFYLTTTMILVKL